MKRVFFFLFCILLVSCSSNRKQDDPIVIAMQQMQLEIEEFKRNIHQLRVENEILEDKFNRESGKFVALKTKIQNQQLLVSNQIQSLQNKETQLEDYIRKFNKNLSETSLTMEEYRYKLNSLEEEIQHLRNNLKYSKQALEDLTETLQEDKMYVVKSGDTLDKIAKRRNTSIEKIKSLNNLQNDRIFVGQKLRLP